MSLVTSFSNLHHERLIILKLGDCGGQISSMFLLFPHRYQSHLQSTLSLHYLFPNPKYINPTTLVTSLFPPAISPQNSSQNRFTASCPLWLLSSNPINITATTPFTCSILLLRSRALTPSFHLPHQIPMYLYTPQRRSLSPLIL